MRLTLVLSVLCWLGLTTAHAGTVTGYDKGRKTTIKLVVVGDVYVEQRTARAFREMARAARKAGLELAIRSGFRTHELQTMLYDAYRRGWGHPAARPGFSNHQNGRALDIYITDYRVYEWLRKHAGKFGFKRTVKREAWHWEYVARTERIARRKRPNS